MVPGGGVLLDVRSSLPELWRQTHKELFEIPLVQFLWDGWAERCPAHSSTYGDVGDGPVEAHSSVAAFLGL